MNGSNPFRFKMNDCTFSIKTYLNPCIKKQKTTLKLDNKDNRLALKNDSS